MKDSILCVLFRVIVFFMRFLPIEAWLFLGRGCGWFYYCLAGRQNRKALYNLRIAFADRPPEELKRIVRQMYIRFAQNFIETLYLPYIDKSYIDKYIQIKGFDYVRDALVHKRGVIFLGVHAGSWELSNAACALILKDHSYAMLAQPQSRHKKIDAFLNSLREAKGIHVIRVDELKKLVNHLSVNNVLGTIADHGGQDGVAVDFFSKPAMTPTGSVKLAKKLGSKIILAFMRRRHGPYHEMIFSSCELSLSADAVKDTQVNLTNINRVFEEKIRRFPCEYLWLYKRWKYSPQKTILILSDMKSGHFNQSLALARMIESLEEKVTARVADVKFKNPFFSGLLTLFVFFFGPRLAECFLPVFVLKETYAGLTQGAYDIVISAGSSVAAANLVASFRNMARSLAIMRPGIFSVSRFHLVIAPDHDRLPKRKNVLSVAGSVNSVNVDSIKKDFLEFRAGREEPRVLEDNAAIFRIGLMIGGDSKNYELSPEIVDFLCAQLKKFLDEFGAVLFLTTSRRTDEKVVKILESCFKNDSSCRLFVDASRDNPRGTVGAILYLSDVVIVSGESISMVSEAVSSGKHVIVFETRRKAAVNKVERFLNFMKQKGYIYLVKPGDLYETLSWIARVKPAREFFDTQGVIKEKLKQIL